MISHPTVDKLVATVKAGGDAAPHCTAFFRELDQSQGLRSAAGWLRPFAQELLGPSRGLLPQDEGQRLSLELSQSLRQAKQGFPDAVALYIEYFFDGSPESNFSLASCRDYADVADEVGQTDWMDDVWGYTEGPSVLPFFWFDTDRGEFTESAIQYLSACAHAELIEITAACLDELPGTVPVAFAKHDDPYVRLNR